jgi:hypothetical protein
MIASIIEMGDDERNALSHVEMRPSPRDTTVQNHHVGSFADSTLPDMDHYSSSDCFPAYFVLSVDAKMVSDKSYPATSRQCSLRCHIFKGIRLSMANTITSIT